MRYLTVLNKRTGNSVPFRIGEKGEIVITSSDTRNNDETCKVVLSKVFYEYSLDFKENLANKKFTIKKGT